MLLSLTLLSMAAVTDIRCFQISNRLVVSGLFSGCVLQILQRGAGGIGVFLINVSIPVILFYLLFLIRALGAGDIKLFSIIGGIWGFDVLCTTIAAAFLVAAFMSLGKILFHHNFISRLQIFAAYMEQTLASGKLLKYPQDSQDRHHVIHFSISILIGYAIAMEVTY